MKRFFGFILLTGSLLFNAGYASAASDDSTFKGVTCQVDTRTNQGQYGVNERQHYDLTKRLEAELFNSGSYKITARWNGATNLIDIKLFHIDPFSSEQPQPEVSVTTGLEFTGVTFDKVGIYVDCHAK